MKEISFKEKIIAFVDILGFKKLVADAEAGTGMNLRELLELVQELGTPEEQKTYEKYGPMTCPQSKVESRGIDFKITQISDCVIVSAEVSPAGVINLISHCWGAVMKLLTKGIMCRGYITLGSIYHSKDQVIGTGYQRAYANESQVTAFKRHADERGTPFVEVDPVVCDYVRTNGDECVKTMFGRFVETDGDATALYPFNRLSHSFIIAGSGHVFDPERERVSNHNVRLGIHTLIDRVMASVDNSNPRAVEKAAHYVAALKAQLAVCDHTDEIIAAWSS